MAKSVTLADVASLVGVSVSTASRALAGHRKISDGTKRRIWQAAAGLGYQRRAHSAGGGIPAEVLRSYLTRAAAAEGHRRSEDWRAGYRRAVRAVEDAISAGIVEGESRNG